jgi:hypothetical protein
MESDVPLKSRFIPCLFLFCLIFSGCFQVHRRDVSHPAPLPDSFSESGTNPLPEKWWESFNDFQLNTLIEEALGQNFTIRAAWDRLSQAEEIAIKSGAALLPNADYLANARRTRQDVSDIVSYTSDYSLGLIASYEVDLWGRVRSSQQAAVLDAEAAKETVNAAAITLSAAIAKTWYQLAEAKQQEVVVTNQLNTNQKVLDIITLQFKQGQINAADVFRQRQLIESSRGQLILAKETIVLLQHQLSLLIGKNPRQYWAQDAIELFTPEQLPEISIPSDVLQRRPDNTHASVFQQPRKPLPPEPVIYSMIGLAIWLETPPGLCLTQVSAKQRLLEYVLSFHRPSMSMDRQLCKPSKRWRTRLIGSTISVRLFRIFKLNSHWPGKHRNQQRLII